MSTSHNPFAQGGWISAGSGHSRDGFWDTSGSPPSIFGALPYPSSPALPPPVPNSILFVFTEFAPSILNCTVTDNRAATVFSVATETTPRFTFVKDRDARNIAMLEWQTHPLVEVRGVVPRMEVRAWLALSQDARSRIMTVGNTRYAWAPSGSHILLYTTGTSVPAVLAKISKTPNSVTLELSPAALELGLLQCAIVATVLMQSGRNID
ncbi:hypothetical protein NEOLEDRAFT_1124910 [Neolentinus lepideus HHB14362 ss-1]|uniref:DUF6593 domain-containing protein n=1 Tax=Neolentinus lepideus HHB14362 ss-1 TaxID=1314782 RepID=A0A165MW10_9AGAM|nr:hypothetical protein NEOLEDRAFT_1124910 [Neolentinus lepideus HHB14362 ss-1]